jgi:hypothetical protein
MGLDDSLLAPRPGPRAMWLPMALHTVGQYAMGG